MSSVETLSKVNVISGTGIASTGGNSRSKAIDTNSTYSPAFMGAFFSKAQA